MKKEPKVAILVLNWEGEKISKDCISSLIKNTNYKNYKIIFVDNGSKDNSVRTIRKNFSRIDILENKENLGFPKGMNVGARYAKKKYNPDYYLFLNNDIIFFKKNWLKELITPFEDKKVGITNPLLLFPNKEIQRVGSKIDSTKKLIITSVTSIPEEVSRKELKKNKIREIDMFLGACFLVKKEIIEKIGLLDERYSPYLIEDLEYSYRAKKAGYKIVTITSSEVIHLFHETFNKKVVVDKQKDLKRVHIVIRNAFLFSLDYLGLFRTIFMTFPLLFITSIFEKKDKAGKNSLRNMKFRKYFWKRFFNFFRSLRGAIKLYHYKEDTIKK